jgi:murein DD-endopeptidase MepM/ murein hydrolase activator NlpD
MALLLLTACAPSADAPGASDGQLEPYSTGTPVNTSPPIVSVAETPLPTATPFTYVIRAGDTISELAETYNVSQDDLRAANPDLNPNSMTIGMTILIPSASSGAAGASTPIPVPAPITQTICHPSIDSGLWCFALVHNNTVFVLENVSVQITLKDANGGVIASQLALLPLDILPPDTSLPAYVFFPETPANAIPQVQLLSALQMSAGNKRYLPAAADNTLARIDGDFAQLSGQVHLPAESQAATRVWVAAVAYDGNGQVVGVRRWEGGAIQPGMGIPFSFTVTSTGSRIERVEFVVQANP